VTPCEALSTLRKAGLTVTAGAANGAIHLTPKSRITPELRALAVEHKQALLAHLRREAEVAALGSEIGAILPGAKLLETVDHSQPFEGFYADSVLARAGFSKLSNCRVCRGKCKWCQRGGVESCGACNRGQPILESQPTVPFAVVVADPPWQFDDKLPGPGRGADKHYRTLPQLEIERFPLPPIADDALLFLWRVSSMVEEAYRVTRAWGFVPKSEIVWLKRTSKGNRWFGMGRIVRAEHESCIVAKRGQPVILSNSIRSTFEAQAGIHSRKPDEFYALVEQLAPGPYLELFARRERPGWICLGDEVPNARQKLNSQSAGS